MCRILLVFVLELKESPTAHERKAGIMPTTNVIMELDYHGIGQGEASETLELQAEVIVELNDGIVSHEGFIGSAKVAIGRILNTMFSNGLAIAAYAPIDGTNEAGQSRDWTDGRETELSAFVKSTLPDVHTKKVSDWRKMARDFDSLEAREVDTDSFAPSAFLTLLSDADMDIFADVVKAVASENDGTVTAKDFVKAGREAGIVKAKANDDRVNVKVSKSDIPRQPVLVPLNTILPALRDAKKDGTTFTKTQRNLMVTVSELLKDLFDEAIA